jgi:hypothetical protein
VKTRALVLVSLLCIPLVFTLIPPAYASSPQLEIIDFQRNVHLQEYGILLMTDDITFFNPGLEPAFFVEIAYPLSEIDTVKAFNSVTENGTDLLWERVTRLGSDSTGWRVYLSEPIMPNRSVVVETQMTLAGLASLDELNADVVLPPIPTSPYFIQSYTTTFTFHDALTSPSQREWTGASVQPYSFRYETVVLQYTDNDFLPLITYLELKRTYFIDAWGFIFAREDHTFRLDSINPEFTNRDKRWTSIEVTLPPGSEFIRVYDRLHNLSSSVILEPTNANQPGTLSVGFSYFLQEGDVYQFFVEYRIPLDFHQLVLQTGQFFYFDPYFEEPWLIENQISEFVLPVGSWLQEVPVGSDVSISPTGQYLVSCLEVNVTSLQRAEIRFNYIYPIAPALARPLVFFLIIILISFMYIVVRRVPYFREEEEELVVVRDVDPAILGEFCTLYGEKIALLLQTERLEQSMLQGKISKPRYRKEKKNFERKIRTLNGELANRSQQLIEAGGKYESSCRELEILEAERISAIEALHALEQRYRQKRITAQVYQKLQKDLQKRRDKAVSRMDRILLGLREELNE